MTITPPKPELKPVMTNIPLRNPQWKQHRNIGQAKSAITNSVSGSNGPGSGYYSHKNDEDNPLQVYELVDGDWKLLWEIQRRTPKSELPWNKEK